MKNFKKVFKVKCPIIGMIHIDPLPGTPKYKGKVKSIIDKAVKEAEFYSEAGIDAIAIENMHDVPYLNRNVGSEISTLMSIIGYGIKQKINLPIGIQILAGANKEAMAAANSAGLDFIRAEGFVFSHIADEGLMNSDAGELLRYRKQIGAENILVFTDIKKKHSSHSITADVTIEETAKAAEFFLSDGLIITGRATGEEANIDEIKSVKKSTKLPIIVGSGVNLKNLENYFPFCDAMIIGSYFKQNGNWENGVDKNRVDMFVKKVNELRIK
ncbi:MAG: BtpA/SgcQ family protein [Ignavibacteriales bacterium]|nr:BtpA/SgcQ family protein [Ignavibacteriales bacterium]